MIETELSRLQLAKSFLEDFFQSSAYASIPMEGDAGNRSYARITHEERSYIFMDCPPDYASTEPFVKIAKLIGDNRLRAPTIFATDVQKGFLLLEDFGKVSAKNHLETITDHKDASDFYKLTIDALCKLQEATPPRYLKQFNNELMISELDVFLDWYVGEEKSNEFQEFRELWRQLLAIRPRFDDSIVLRDYHVENIMMIPGQDPTNIDSLGLLDFQDALIGSPIYDLVSILEDARIEVSRELALEMIDYFATKKGYGYNDCLLEHSILGLQRNLRILGVFRRKFKRDNAEQYLQYIPRVLNYISYDLRAATEFDCPELKGIQDWQKKNNI